MEVQSDPRKHMFEKIWLFIHWPWQGPYFNHHKEFVLSLHTYAFYLPSVSVKRKHEFALKNSSEELDENSYGNGSESDGDTDIDNDDHMTELPTLQLWKKGDLYGPCHDEENF